MKICNDNGWQFVTVPKEDSLKLLQEYVIDVGHKHRHCIECHDSRAKGKTHILRKYEFVATSISGALTTPNNQYLVIPQFIAVPKTKTR